MKTYNNILLHLENEVLTVTVNRPDKLNALNHETIQEIGDAVKTAEHDPSIAAIVITGAGSKSFVAGADIAEFSHYSVEEGKKLSADGHKVFKSIEDCSKPVIAAVNGAAAGGGLALVLGSDIRLAAASARFSAAFIKIGVSGCDIGTSWLLPRIVGAGAAHEMMLTGRLVDAAEAARRGLVLEVVDDDVLLERALDEARLIQANAPLAVRMTKETMWASLEVGGLAAAISLENHTQLLCLGSDDQREAVAAFLEKRPPRWAPQAD